MFDSLIVATDIETGPDRALAFVTSLANRHHHLSIEVLTVVTSHSDLSPVERQRRATALGVAAQVTSVVGDDVAGAIVDNVRNRDRALLVMFTHGTGLVSLVRRSIVGQVLAELRRPLLVIGPHTSDVGALATATLIVAIDRTRSTSPALPVVEAWQRGIGGGRPWIVEVVASGARPTGTITEGVETEHAVGAVDILSAHGIDATPVALRGNEPVRALLDFADTVPDAVFVMTSDRWAGGRTHWYSTTRQLVQRSTRPVLVVPGDLPGYAGGGNGMHDVKLAVAPRTAHSRVMALDRLGVTVLSANDCLELLRSTEVGRIAVSIADQPDIFPINYVVDRGTVVFRTAEGTKLSAAILGRGVAFEADGYDAANGEAWSVVIKGQAVEIERLHELYDAVDLPLFPWHAAPKHHFVRIEPIDISGRRFDVTTGQLPPRTAASRAASE